MGYRPQRKILKLRFEDYPEYEGLVVRARSLNVGTFMRLNALSVRAASVLKRGIENVEGEDLAAIDELFQVFATSLVDWNLEDEDTGEPVPATFDGVKSQDLDFIFPIINAWFTAMAQVSSPLGQRSSNGVRSLEQSIPMEAR